MTSVEFLGWLRWTWWSESSSVLCWHAAAGIHQSCARSKYVLISSVNRPCEPWQNQIFEFVYLLGNQTSSLWPEHLLLLWERQGWVHEQVLGWRREEGPSKPVGPESCFILSVLSILATLSKHSSNTRVSEHSFSLFASSFTLGCGLKRAPGTSPQNRDPRNFMLVLCSISVYSRLNKWQNLTSVDKSC